MTQSNNDFLRLKQELANGTLKQENGKAKVELVTNDGIKYPQSGTLEFSDVTVDQTTGSITLRAIFPNPDHTLLPGMFVRVWKKGLTQQHYWFHSKALPAHRVAMPVHWLSVQTTKLKLVKLSPHKRLATNG